MGYLVTGLSEGDVIIFANWVDAYRFVCGLESYPVRTDRFAILPVDKPGEENWNGTYPWYVLRYYDYKIHSVRMGWMPWPDYQIVWAATKEQALVRANATTHLWKAVHQNWFENPAALRTLPWSKYKE